MLKYKYNAKHINMRENSNLKKKLFFYYVKKLNSKDFLYRLGPQI